jgi:CspA family cold shock protein
METIVFFNDIGGYDLIETDAREQEVFYNMEDIGGADIKEGQKINLILLKLENALRATDVERL